MKGRETTRRKRKRGEEAEEWGGEEGREIEIERQRDREKEAEELDSGSFELCARSLPDGPDSNGAAHVRAFFFSAFWV